MTAAAAPRSLILAGVGGQGVLLASNVVAQVCLDAGLDVKKSEVHGMSQRGGTVVSHIRFGPTVHSVTVEPHTADWVVAFEWAEGLRCLGLLGPGGTAFISRERWVPPSALDDRRGGHVAYPLDQVVPEQVVPVDTFTIAAEAAAAKAAVAQTVMLGVLSRQLEFPADAWTAAIERWAPAKSVPDNLLAFERGRRWEAPRAGTLPRVAPAPAVGPPAEPPPAPVVTIEAAWCKGCEICVAVCPERCLVMDAHDIAVFAHPERCTGCRLCSWLCPDLAIDVAAAAAAPVPA